MDTKLDAIKWAFDHIDESYTIGSKEYRVVGAGFNGEEWTTICRGEVGWTKIDLDDCILADLPEDEFNNFKYVEIELLWDQRKKV